MSEYIYGEPKKGGVWYYKQDKPGTPWFDNVDNDKGWTVDFNLKVSDIQDSKDSLLYDVLDGVGIYVNDGVAKESITFLTQEIIFQNSNKKVIYDTTSEKNYRLLGKKNGLQLFARDPENNQTPYTLIAEAPFNTISTEESNASRPSIVEDINGDFHMVWVDDGNKIGQIYYSKFTDENWSIPEKITDSPYGARDPKIIIDNENNIYVAYEYLDRAKSTIALIYKNDLGWSNPYLLGVEDGFSKKPDMTFDSQYNVIIVWQDNRFANPEIYLNKFNKETLSLEDEVRLTDDFYIISEPAISSYFDDIIVTWTREQVNEDKNIQIIKYNSVSGQQSSIEDLVSDGNNADFSDVLINVAGEIIVVWQDIIDERKHIFSSILNLDLDITTSSFQVTSPQQSNGGCSFPVLSEQSNTGTIYIVWQDYLSDYELFNDSDEYDPYNSVVTTISQPRESGIFYATYSEGIFYSSGNGGVDQQISLSQDEYFSIYAYRPAIPSWVTNFLPISYEAYNFSSKYLNTKQLFKFVGSYHLSDEYVDNGPFAVSGYEDRKEIRFGDYSRNLNIHYSFKNFKYYLEDAVPPYFLRDINSSDFPSLDSLTASDISINNYGDVWLVGTCGMYYYIERTEGIALVGSGDDADIIASLPGHIKSLGFSKSNSLHVVASDGVYASQEHVRCYSKVIDDPNEEINLLSFDRDGDLFIGKGSDLIRYDNNYTIQKTHSLAGTITAIEVDDNNIVWVGTTNGLYRVYNDRTIKYTTANGLICNRVNDIAIRNTAIRYIATAAGINKMIGSAFDREIRSSNESIWNENVKSIMWQNPNILWAGTLSKINQIIINDIEDSYQTFVLEPSPSQVIREDDLQQYYILLEDTQTFEKNDIVEVYINGNFIHHGYSVGFENGQPLIYFEIPLQSTDVVEVVVRKDLKLRTSFEQTSAEKVLVGEKLIRIRDLDVGDNIYIISEGDENEVKVNDSNTQLPFDRVHLDTTPPTGTIDIPDNAQVDQTKIQVNITGTDTFNGVAGSGVSQMIVSNFDNFTTDGVTLQNPVPFATRYEHDLGSTVQNVTFASVGEGGGSVIQAQSVSGTNELFYATSNPGRVYKYNMFDNEWELLFSYDNDNYVDFVINYSTKLIVSVGSDTDIAKLYIYEYQYDENGFFTGYSSGITLAVAESRIYSYAIFNGLLYIGTGKGLGDEYSEGIAPNGGKVYYYDESVLKEVVRELDDDVYDFAIVPGNNNLIAVTGESGFVYEVDVNNSTAFPVHNDVESLFSTAFIQQGEDGLIFIGGKEKGTIRRSKTDSNSYDISFQTTPGVVSSLKVFKITKNNETVDILYAAVGNVLYYLSSSGAWVWKYTHTSDIRDITYNSSTGFIHLAVENGVVRLAPTTQEKQIYLKLIDKAGNESSLFNDEGSIKEDFTDSISISDLVDFVNENKIFELDELGNTVFTLKGNNNFFSADKVGEEKGVYTSEIFDGTNDLIKWDTLSWQATEMANTEVKIYVRTSTSRNDILLEEWVGPYYNTQASGVDLSHFSGQFLQFKIELTSKVKDISPTFHKATIQAITSEAIHFFTTNFVMTGRVHKGILTSQKLVPVSADVVFGINTTNSVDWSDYQIIEENRIFNVNQIGENVRVGIKLLSPSRTISAADAFDEYGPYNSDLYVNTIDFSLLNNTGLSQNYHFKITLYEDINLENEIYSAYSWENSEGFNANGEKIEIDGVTIPNNSTASILFTVPGSANIRCNTYYFVKIESIYDFDEEGEGVFDLISDDASYIASCNSSFVDTIDFNFTNNEGIIATFDFRIRFYSDPERTNIYKTVFSQNDRTGWFVDDSPILDTGTVMNQNDTINVVYRPDLEDFESGVNYYISIDAWEQNQMEYVFSSNAYTFQARDATSLIYCGGYADVPVVKNFGIMLELEDNQFVTLNL